MPPRDKQIARAAHHQRLQERTAGETDNDGQRQDHEPEVFGRTEFQGLVGQQGAEEGQPQDPQRPGDEGADGGDSQSRSAPALLGERISIEAGGHGSDLSRDIEENGSSGTTVHGAVKNSRHHDDRRGGLQYRRQRDQDGDGRSGTQPGQDSDNGPQDSANGRHQQIHGAHRRNKARAQVHQCVHRLNSQAQNPDGERHLKETDERQIDTGGQESSRHKTGP